MATTVVKDISNLMTDTEGMVPWLPNNLSDGETMRWAEGLRWESIYFNTDEEAASFRPEDLWEDVREERKMCLLRLYQATRDNPEPLFHQTVVTLDRLLLTQELPSDISMMEAVTACHLKQLLNYRGADEVAEMAESLKHSLNLVASTTEFLASAAWIEKTLGKFSNIDVHTAADWYKRITPAGCFADSEIDTVFMYLGVDGSLAHYTPSSVAAAVMVKFMGSLSEPYMRGYDLLDIATVKAEVDWILDEKNLP